MKELSATKLIEISFSDIDSMHIVWHGKYVKYFEDAREKFGRKYGFRHMAMYENKYMLPIVDLEVSYKKMVGFEEFLRVEITYIPTESAKLIFTYIIYNEAGETVCTGKTTQVITTIDGVLSLTNPNFVKAWKEKWLSLN